MKLSRESGFFHFVTGSECPAAFAQGARKLTAILRANNVKRRAAAAGSPEVTESLPGTSTV
ncbi:MAG: hypothetical protein ING75_01820 [Rhodocyclaceae bacterium]|nr:hypothetical protein [Rhodocyclaceae bacterium]